MTRFPAASLRRALFLLVLLPAAAAAQQETQDTTALPQTLRPAIASLAQAFGKLDAVAAANHFADNASVEIGGQVLSGKAQVSGWLTEMVASLSALRTGTASKYIVGAEEVTERAQYTVTTMSGEEQGGTSETVWRRQADGSWKVVRLIVL